ncbi:MAG: hypothetical protein H7Z73_01640 [Candidatus Saccharibacteria bacterium]|nr:hypothetical protein [Moraxellaceae bacterium]
MEFKTVFNDVNQDLPLIYMWEIINLNGEVFGRYVGKSIKADRPLKRYKLNVINILNKKPYHNKSKPDGYRAIHKKLAEAHIDGSYSIILTFLCNVLGSQNINEIEQYWIKEKNSQGKESWQLNK